eukprot:ANDGO_00715.mRNA.1 hypothetical protein
MEKEFDPHVAEVRIRSYKTRTLPFLLVAIIASVVLVALGFTSACSRKWGYCPSAEQRMRSQGFANVKCTFCPQDGDDLCESAPGCSEKIDECVCAQCDGDNRDSCINRQCFRDGQDGLSFDTWCIQDKFEWAKTAGVFGLVASTFGFLYIWTRLIRDEAMVRSARQMADTYRT